GPCDRPPGPARSGGRGVTGGGWAQANVDPERRAGAVRAWWVWARQGVRIRLEGRLSLPGYVHRYVESARGGACADAHGRTTRAVDADFARPPAPCGDGRPFRAGPRSSTARAAAEGREGGGETLGAYGRDRGRSGRRTGACGKE